MGTVGAVLPLGVAVSLSPVPIIALVLLLSTPRARRNGIAFVLGWVLGVGGAGAVLVLLAGQGTHTPGQPATWVAVAKTVIGTALVVFGALQWRRRERREQRLAELPAWMHALDRFGPLRAFGLAWAFAVLDPESLLLIASAAAVIAQGAGPGQRSVAYVVFLVLGTAGPASPLAIYLVLGARAEPVLARLRGWLAGHNTAILAVMLLVIGTALLGGGIGDLSA